MKKFVALALALVLVFSMGVPSFGATSVTIDESGVFAPDQSNTNYSISTVFTNLNILEAIRVLADSSAYDIHKLYDLFNSSYSPYKTVAEALRIYINGTVSSVASYGNGNLGDMMSTFAYLGHTIQGLNYYSPYTDSLVSLDDALNYNLLYITNQLKVITNHLASSSSADSGLMSGWALSGVPAPEGYSTSWYYRLLQNVGSLATNFSRLYNGTWADSENYGDSFFYQTYLQNKIISDSFTNLLSNWSYDIVTVPDGYSSSWFYSILRNIYGSYENSESFEDIYLEQKNFEYLDFISQGLLYNVQYNGTFSHAVTNSLSSIGQALTLRLSTSFDNPFSSSGKTSVNTSYGTFNNMLQHMNHQSGFLARLAYVLADDEEIRLNETIHDSKSEVVDFVGEGVASSSGSSFSIMSGLTDGIEFSSAFFDFFDMGLSLDDVWFMFGEAEAFSWFTEETASNIDSVPATYSREPNPKTEIVTSYYEDRQAEFTEKWGALIG